MRTEDFKKPSPLIMEGARIMWPNFAGKEKEFNEEGDRNFCVAIEDPELVNKLVEDKWNVRIWMPKPGDDGEDPKPVHYIKVKVSFKFNDARAPKIVMVTARNQVLLDESSVGILDTERIANADLTIVPRVWDDHGEPKVKAYLKTLYATIEEDEWANKYGQ